MTRPAKPTAPPQALRSDPATFSANAEGWIGYQATTLPTWMDSLTDYMDGLATEFDSELADTQTAKTDAETAQGASEAARDLALSYRDTAETHKNDAATSAGNASTSEANAADSATDAANSAAAAALFDGANYIHKVNDVLGDVSNVDETGVGEDYVLRRSGSNWIAVPYERPIGYGQTWQNLTASRAQNTAYQNTTGQPIVVSIVAGPSTDPSHSGTIRVSLDGVNWVDVTTRIGFSASETQYRHVGASDVIIPPGHYYQFFANASSYVPDKWMELRA